MKIIVLVKQVPDTWGERKLSLATGVLDRAASDTIIDEIGERALEVALLHKDAIAPRNPQFEMLRPSRKSLPESITKSTYSIRRPVPFNAPRHCLGNQINMMAVGPR